MLKPLLAAVVCVLFASAATAETATLELKDAWARATPGGAQTAAAYLTIESPTADRLTGADTPVAAKAELHIMKTENGVMKMRPLADIDLPAGKPITLKPGAMHIMLMGLKAPLRPGQSFPLTLHFAKAGTREVNVAVEKVGAMGMPGHAGGGTAMPMPMHH
jgi:hypothetical protein